MNDAAVCVLRLRLLLKELPKSLREVLIITKVSWGRSSEQLEFSYRSCLSVLTSVVGHPHALMSLELLSSDLADDHVNLCTLNFASYNSYYTRFYYFQKKDQAEGLVHIFLSNKVF